MTSGVLVGWGVVVKVGGAVVGVGVDVGKEFSVIGSIYPIEVTTARAQGIVSLGVAVTIHPNSAPASRLGIVS